MSIKKVGTINCVNIVTRCRLNSELFSEIKVKNVGVFVSKIELVGV